MEQTAGSLHAMGETMISDETHSRESSSWESDDRLHAVDYCFFVGISIAALVVAWADAHTFKGDSIAYYDLSEAVRLHRWQACFNASWFPLYPALITLARALFHFNPQYDAAATRLINFVGGLALLASAIFFAMAVKLHVLARKAAAGDQRGLLANRSLMVLMATVTFFFWCVDMGSEKPDTVLAVFSLTATALLLRGLLQHAWWPFVAAGVLAGCAYWTKAFAFPYVCLVLFFLALSQRRNGRALLQLTVATVAFLAVAAPYIAHISADKHRFTIGDAGRLNSAWYVNGADRLNPVADHTLDDRGTAVGEYLHPPELLARTPEVVYFAPGHVFGQMPAWDDFSYWSDGLAPRFSPRGTLRAFTTGIKDLVRLLPFRAQIVALFAVMWIFGLRWSTRRRRDPVLVAVASAALVSILLYLSVHFEGRYIVCAVLIGAAIVACTARAVEPVLQRKLHQVLLVVGLLLVLAEAQTALRALHSAPAGDDVTHLHFETAEYNAGKALQARFGQNAQVACMGQEACYDDSLWAWYGKLTVSAVITMPHRPELAKTAELCNLLHQSGPATLDALRARHIKAVVTWFGAEGACSAEWQPLREAPSYFVLPL